MPEYIEYELDDGTIILIAAPENSAGGLTPASRGSGKQPARSQKTFQEALQPVIKQAQAMRASLENLRADEVEVSFGLTTTGEAGNFAIGKVGIEANYKVTLKWKNPKAPDKA